MYNSKTLVEFAMENEGKFFRVSVLPEFKKKTRQYNLSDCPCRLHDVVLLPDGDLLLGFETMVDLSEDDEWCVFALGWEICYFKLSQIKLDYRKDDQTKPVIRPV